MDLALIGRLGMQQLSSHFFETIYIKSGVDLTRPTEVRASLTTRCNYKCLHCGCWRESHGPEMSIEQWKNGLASVKEFIGRYRIQFAGGEPFVKKGFLDLLEFCRAEAIDFGVITNGSAFTNDRIVARFVSALPMKVEISVDGPTPEIHDRLRGVPGSLEAIEAGIRNLRRARREAGASFPIRIKPTLNSVNFRAMPDLVNWAVDQGATSIDIEPNREWTDESKAELWLSPEETVELESIVTELLRMKADGLPIETSEHRLLSMPDHFRRRKVASEVGVCRIGLRVFSINPRGAVTSCFAHLPLGDLTRQSAREIWTEAAAREVRRRTVACDRGCPYGCLSSKPIVHTIKRGLMVFAGKANHDDGPTTTAKPAGLPA
ncbi:radical SAM protein [Paludisphaera borealis]|uniref:Mycofactocin radical SAM maturase MftC n=1 Tax=Paludisphaera borealis TaxID=1387353 RepID=A0A1U7CZ19_9BACT|nr:radical SAM protein [Paludisphaera borealis]APW64175.1 Putative mycofactocin radical SAM maturase MftC [Paludisphaera borealis]